MASLPFFAGYGMKVPDETAEVVSDCLTFDCDESATRQVSWPDRSQDSGRVVFGDFCDHCALMLWRVGDTVEPSPDVVPFRETALEAVSLARAALGALGQEGNE